MVGTNSRLTKKRENVTPMGKHPKIKKRPVTLASRGTPEQPSPRTAQSQDTIPFSVSKSHIGATGWHEAAIVACFQ
jgi:hypothetical protein